MPSTKIESAAITDTLSDVRKMLDKMAWFYCDHKKRDFEDYQAVANLAYVKAYRTFDLTKGALLSTWVWHKTRGELQRYRSKMAKQYANEKQISTKREPIRKPRHLYDRVRSELSEDALLVLRLIAESPGELVKVFRSAKRNPKRTQVEIRKRLRKNGWPTAKMVDVFNEIKEVL